MSSRKKITYSLLALVALYLPTTTLAMSDKQLAAKCAGYINTYIVNKAKITSKDNPNEIFHNATLCLTKNLCHKGISGLNHNECTQHLAQITRDIAMAVSPTAETTPNLLNTQPSTPQQTISIETSTPTTTPTPSISPTPTTSKPITNQTQQQTQPTTQTNQTETTQETEKTKPQQQEKINWF